MKKLGIVAFALVIAMAFVGCGLTLQLVGTTWERSWEADGVSKADRWEFRENNEFVYTFLINSVRNDGYTGTWSVEGDILTLEIEGYKPESYKIEIKGDVMKMYYDTNDDTEECEYDEDIYWEYTKIK